MKEIKEAIEQAKQDDEYLDPVFKGQYHFENLPELLHLLSLVAENAWKAKSKGRRDKMLMGWVSKYESFKEYWKSVTESLTNQEDD